MFRFLTLLIAVSSATLAEAVDINGIVSEPEWQQAEVFDEFFVVEPRVLNEPDLRTEAKMFSNADGIYVAVVSHQPRRQQRRNQGGRDQDIRGDSVRVFIDFDGNGDVAYVFELGLGSGRNDGVLQNARPYRADWDGDWQGVSRASEDRWVAEFFIPWDIAPVAKARHARRRAGLYVDRYMASSSLRVASAPQTMADARFIANFSEVDIDYKREASRLTMRAYAVANNDMLEGDNRFRPGGEAHWQSENGEQQLALGLKPNFDDVTIDKLVLNFTPLEVFFPERRLFFGKHPGLFDLRGNQDLRLLYTRRIAPPEAQGGAVRDVDAVLNYGNTQGAFQYAVLAADESDNAFDDGRRFAAGRLLYQRKNLQGGVLSTYVNSADGERRAQSHSLDVSYREQAGFAFSGLLSFSDIAQSGAIEAETSNQGMAVSLSAKQQITEQWIHQFDVMRYDEEYQINDFGFLPRANLQGFRYRTILNSLESQIHNLEFSTEVLDNISGLDLRRSIAIEYGQSLNNSALWQVQGVYRSPGHDDLITRGNRALKTDEGFLFGLTWQGKARERFYYQMEWQYQDMPIEGEGYYAAFKPSFNISPQYALHLDMVYINRQDWKIWQADNLINTHHRQQFYADFNLVARIGDKQKLQLNAQWISLAAAAQDGGEVATNGALQSDNRVVAGFSVADTGLQLRYSYQLMPRATLLMIYRRAGRYEEQYLNLGAQELSDRSPFGTLPNSWQQRSQDNLLLRLDWTF